MRRDTHTLKRMDQMEAWVMPQIRRKKKRARTLIEAALAQDTVFIHMYSSPSSRRSCSTIGICSTMTGPCRAIAGA